MGAGSSRGQGEPHLPNVCVVMMAMVLMVGCNGMCVIITVCIMLHAQQHITGGYCVCKVYAIICVVATHSPIHTPSHHTP